MFKLVSETDTLINGFNFYKLSDPINFGVKIKIKFKDYCRIIGFRYNKKTKIFFTWNNKIKI